MPRSSSPATNPHTSTARRSWSMAVSPLRTSRPSSALAVGALCAVAAAALADLAWRVRDWVVMTDELQYVKLATHIGETLSPLPTIRGAHFAAYAQLYPALITPFYGTMSAPDAFRAAHLLNAVVFARAGAPPFLVARASAFSPPWSLACA